MLFLGITNAKKNKHALQKRASKGFTIPKSL